MQVAPPPLMEHLLLEQPWPAAIALGAVAAVLWVIAGRRRSGRLRWASLGALVAAVGVLGLGYAITTDREHLLTQTARLVDATESPLDLATIDTLVAADATLVGPHGEVWATWPEVRDQLQRLVPNRRLDTQTLRAAGAEITAPGWARVVFDLRTVFRDNAMGPIRTVWALTWRRGPDGSWRVSEIRWLEFQNRPPDEGMWRW